MAILAKGQSVDYNYDIFMWFVFYVKHYIIATQKFTDSICSIMASFTKSYIQLLTALLHHIFLSHKISHSFANTHCNLSKEKITT